MGPDPWRRRSKIRRPKPRVLSEAELEERLSAHLVTGCFECGKVLDEGTLASGRRAFLAHREICRAAA